MQVSIWDFEEVCILIEAVINWELQQISLDQKGQAIEVAASHLLKVHGYKKTTKQCEEQWKYVASGFRRGGYRHFRDQINLIYLLAPSLLTTHSDTQHMSKFSIRNDEQQQIYSEIQTEVPSSETESVAMTQSSKKLNRQNKDFITETLKVEIVNDSENDDSENVTSYVEINVSKNNNKAKHHVEISTDELEDDVRFAKLSPKENLTMSQNRKKKPVLLRNAENETPVNMKQKAKVKRPCSPLATVQFTGKRSKRKRESSPAVGNFSETKPLLLRDDEDLVLTKPPKNKVQVEVLNITESESAQIIECQTMPDITPTRTFKLYYPTNHPLPTRVKHLYIPREIIHPSTTPSSRNVNISKSQVVDMKSDLHSSSSSEALSVSDESQKSELNIEASEQIESCALGTGASGNSERESLLSLMHQYSWQCQQEKKRLFSVIHDSNQEHISLLKEVLAVFRELKSSV